MKELKKEFRWFNIMEYEKEENYLSKRHQEGWKFKRVTFPGVYTFERCEPEKVIYQLDYNKEGIKHQMEYVRMFEDCGWEYLTEFDGYNYFRKPADKMQQKEEIFCDDISRLDMMNRIFIGSVTYTIEDQLAEKELLEIINDFLGKMNAGDRDIFVRRYWFFDSVAAIAKRHAMSVGSVKMNLYRSRKKLLKVLKKEGKHL